MTVKSPFDLPRQRDQTITGQRRGRRVGSLGFSEDYPDHWSWTDSDSGHHGRKRCSSTLSWSHRRGKVHRKPQCMPSKRQHSRISATPRHRSRIPMWFILIRGCRATWRYDLGISLLRHTRTKMSLLSAILCPRSPQGIRISNLVTPMLLWRVPSDHKIVRVCPLLW